jgi:hypothetical protein
MLDTTSHRDHFDSAVIDAQPHRTPEITAHRFTNERNTVMAEHLPGGNEVPLTHLYGARWGECREHAGPAGQSGGDPPRLRSVGRHQLEQARHSRLGKLGGIGIGTAECRRGQEHVGQASYASLGVVKQNRHAASETLGNQDIVVDPYPKIGHPHYQLAAAHALSR